MTIQVQGPGGAQVDFPDGTDPSVMDAAMRRHFSTGQYVAAPTPQPTVGADGTPQVPNFAQDEADYALEHNNYGQPLPAPQAVPTPQQAPQPTQRPVNPYTGSYEEPEFSLGGTVSNTLGGFDQHLGNIVAGIGSLLVPQGPIGDAIRSVTGGLHQNYDAATAGPAPANIYERVGRSFGGAAADTLPAAVPVAGIAGTGARVFAPAAEAASTEAAPVASRVVNNILDATAEHPVAATLGQMEASGLSGAAGQAVHDDTEPGTIGREFGEPMAAMAAGIGAPGLMLLSPTANAARLGIAAGKRVFRALTPPAESMAAREAATADYQNGVTDTPPPVPGFLERAQDAAVAGRRQDSLARVGQQLKPIITAPEVQGNISQAEALKSAVPGFSPTVGQSTGAKALINLENRFGEQATGPDLAAQQGKYDQNTQAIRGFADNVVPPVADPDANVALSLQSGQAAQLAPIDQQIGSTQQAIKDQTAQLPIVNSADVGANLRTGADTARDAANAQVATQRAQIDPDGTYRGDSAALGAAIQKKLAPLGTDLTDPAIPPQVKRLLVKTTGSTSPVLGPDGQQVQSAPPSYDVSSLLDARQRVGQDLRRYAAGTTPEAMRAADALSATRDALDDAVNQVGGGVGQRLATFNQNYRENYVPRFGQGLTQQMGKTAANSAEKVADEDILPKLIAPNAASEQKQFNLVHGNDPAAQKQVTDYALDDIRRSAVQPDGTIAEGAVQKWMDAHSRTLDNMPWLRDAVASKDPQKLYDNLQGLQNQRAQVADSDLAQQLGTAPEQTIDAALKNPRLARTIKDSVGTNPDALAALQRAVWNRATAAGGKDALLDPAKMQAFLDNNRQTLGIFLDPKHIADLETIIQAATVQGRTARPAGAIQTSDNIDAVSKGIGLSIPSMLSRLNAIGQGRLSKEFMISEVGLRAANKFNQGATENAWKEALTNNRVAETLAAATKSADKNPNLAARIMRNFTGTNRVWTFAPIAAGNTLQDNNTPNPTTPPKGQQ